MSREVSSKNSSSAVTGSNRRKAGNEGSTPPVDGSGQARPRVAMATNMEPTYYIGGGNGNALIEETLNSVGWRRIKDKNDESYRLRWCELKSSINYNTFKEGDQLVNHIPNCNLLTNKLGLLDSLEEYSRVRSVVQKNAMKLSFIPETYRLDDPKDRRIFEETYKENEIWICKPTGRNQGKGIFLIRSLKELNQTTQTTEKESQEEQRETGREGEAKGREGDARMHRSSNRIIQRYIINPLLVDGKKFDIRCYMLIASTVPYLVLYHKGYLRLSMYNYDNDCDNIIAHLTNQFIQKKDPKYSELKEETAWSMDRFNQYVNDKLRSAKGLEGDWVYNTLTTTMKQIMALTFTAVKHKLQRRVGFFDLYGFDFLIDDNMKVWLIEVNVNPCLATNCAALREVVPGVVKETLHLAIECFEKSRKGRPLLPLNSLKNFQVLFCDSPSSAKQTSQGTGGGGGGGGGVGVGGGGVGTTRTQMTSTGSSKTDPSKSASPVRRTRSISPAKEGLTRTRKQEPVNPVAQTTKSKTPSGVRESTSVHVIKGTRASQTNETSSGVSPEKHPTAGDNDEKTRTAKAKVSPNKKNDSSSAQGNENTTEKSSKSTFSADKNSNTTPTKSAPKPPNNSASSGGGSKQTGAPPPSAAGKKRIGKEKEKEKENSAIREEKPNRGS